MKLAITHTKKVPGQEEYSSEGFGATIEVEVPDDQAQDAASVQGWLKELYDQAKQAVEQQLASVPRRNGNHQPASGLFQRPNTQPEQRQGNSQGVATPKQISFLVSLGARNKLTFADLQRIAQERFQAADVYQLTRRDASTLIDELKPEAPRR
jgi:hypothetical protein